MIETGRYKQWAVLELFGHRKLAGLVTEVELAGERMLRIEVPSDPPATQTYSAKAVFGISEESEDLCRRYAAGNRPSPISAYELRGPALPAAVDAEEVDDDDDLDDDEAEDDDDDDDDFGCDLCGEAILVGDEWHSIADGDGVHVTACAKCARAEAETKPTRIPVAASTALTPDGEALLRDIVERTTGLPTQGANESQLCPQCKEFPVAIGAGDLPRSTCGRAACLDLAARGQGGL